MNSFQYGMRYWKKHVPCAVFCQLIGFMGLLIDICQPILSAMFIDYILDFKGEGAVKDTVFSFLLKFGEPQTWQLFFVLASVVLGLILIREGLIYSRNILFQLNGLSFESELRDITYKKLGSLDNASIAAYNIGDLFTTLSSDIIQYKEMYSRILLVMGDGFFYVIVTSAMLVSTSVYMIIVPAVLAPALLITLHYYMRDMRKVSERIRNCDAEMNLDVQENINAVRLVRSFANEEFEKAKFDRVNENTYNAYCQQVNKWSGYSLVFNVIRQVAYISTIAVGTIMVFQGKFGIGIMTACSTYVLQIMGYLTNISNMISQLQFGMVAGNHLMSFLEMKPKISDSLFPKQIHDNPNIEVDHLTVIEEGQEILKDVTLSIPFGKKVGIMGGTGSGKSVLLKSLVRIYDASYGSVRINGKDIRNYELDALRKEFSYVFQDVFLFSESVEANIAFYEPNIDRSIIQRVADQAQAGAFIRNLPQGFSTIIGERGVGLSGGQKQRISIARALLKNAPVLVLDDASSALDVTTECAVMDSIKENYPHRTILIAAHRVTSILDCDEILYMKDGEVVERGTFDELMEQNGLFAEIYRMQTSEKDNSENDMSDAILTMGKGD